MDMRKSMRYESNHASDFVQLLRFLYVIQSLMTYVLKSKWYNEMQIIILLVALTS